MRDIKEIFERVQEQKMEQRELAASIRDSFRNSPEHRDLMDQITRLKLKKDQIERTMTDGYAEKIDLLKANIKDSMQVMSDIALSTIMKGESIKLTDAKDNEYEPVFTVRFKKANGRSYIEEKPKEKPAK